MDFGIKFDIHGQLTLNEYMKIFRTKGHGYSLT